MRAEIAVLPGDGIGPEVIDAALDVLHAVAKRHGHQFVEQRCLVGGAAIDATGEALPPDTLAACRRADSVLLGAVGGPKWSDPKAPVRPEQGLLALRRELGLYANLRPVRPHPAALGASPIKSHLLAGVDLLVVRELTGGLYFGEKSRSPDAATDVCTYSVAEIERVVRRAGALASARSGNLASVDKANVLETSRLWRETTTRVIAEEFPNVKLEHHLVDSMAMHLIARPRAFDVIVTENLFGDILTDEASMLAGSMGLLPSASLGDGKRGLYEPIHGSAPDIAGRGIANPIAAILSVAMLLRHSLDLPEAAAAIEHAVSQCLDDRVFTADLANDRPAVSTQQLTRAVLAHLSDNCYVPDLRD
jgi:3-isopropylmalate dehydrogenase